MVKLYIFLHFEQKQQCQVQFVPLVVSQINGKNSEKPGPIMCHKFLLMFLCKFQIFVLSETPSLLHLKSPRHKSKRKTKKGQRSHIGLVPKLKGIYLNSIFSLIHINISFPCTLMSAYNSSNKIPPYNMASQTLK